MIFFVCPSGVSSFLYNELMQITGNFDDRPMSDGGHRLGEGGFGTVYKGVLNNKHVAVKKLNPVSEHLFNNHILILIVELVNHNAKYDLYRWMASHRMSYKFNSTRKLKH